MNLEFATVVFCFWVGLSERVSTFAHSSLRSDMNL